MQRDQPALASSGSVKSEAESARKATCTVCGTTLKRTSDMSRHMQTHAKNKEQLMYKCPYTGCSHKTLQRSNLQTHILTHTNLRPLKCPYLLQDGTKCEFATCDPSSLHRHKRRHEPQDGSGQ